MISRSNHVRLTKHPKINFRGLHVTKFFVNMENKRHVQLTEQTKKSPESQTDEGNRMFSADIKTVRLFR